MKIRNTFLFFLIAGQGFGATGSPYRPDDKRNNGQLAQLWDDWTFNSKLDKARCSLSQEMQLCYHHFKKNHPEFVKLLSTGDLPALVNQLFDLTSICQTPCIAHFKTSSRDQIEHIANCCSRQLQVLIQQDLMQEASP